MLSESEKVIKCMLAMLDGRSGKGYNNYVFLGGIYGIGDVYSDLSIVKRNVSLYDFKSEQITKLLKYKLLGIDGVYLINDIIALDFNKYRLYESRIKVSVKPYGRLYAYKCMNCDFRIEEDSIGSIYLDQCSNCSISYNNGNKPVILRSCIDMKVQTDNVIKVKY